jgi:hypothetical protein
MATTKMTSSGIVFPDTTTQTTAGTPGPPGPTGPATPGPPGPTGPPGLCTYACSGVGPCPSDRRLKENIVFICEQEGLKWYEFNFIGKPMKFIGVIAQEILNSHPDAVFTNKDGFYIVNYTKLGVKFKDPRNGDN